MRPALLLACALSPLSGCAIQGGAAGSGTVAHENAYGYVLHNPLDQPRDAEVVALPVPAELAGTEALEAFDLTTGALLPLQRHAAEDDPGHALVQVSLAPNERKQIGVRPAGADDSAATKSAAVAGPAYGRHVPERKDDFAWENDRVAFRMYGPALQADGEISSGIDVWGKRVRTPVIDRWYAGEDYHTDHGEGLDFYKVGPSRGCGGLALRDANTLSVSKNYVRWRRLANGPLRVVFELDYAPWGPAGRERAETKRISLDAGSNFNRIRSRFDGEPASTPAIGINGPGATGYAADGRWLSHWSTPDPKHGSIGCAIVLPAGDGERFERDGQHWLANKDSTGGVVEYFVGAAWSGGLDYRDAQAWERAVARFAQRAASPIVVEPVATSSAAP